MLVQQLVPNEPKWLPPARPPASFQARAASGPWGRETGREEGSEGAGFKWSSLAHGSHERSLHAEEKHTYTRRSAHTDSRKECRYRRTSMSTVLVQIDAIFICCRILSFYWAATRLYNATKTYPALFHTPFSCDHLL